MFDNSCFVAVKFGWLIGFRIAKKDCGLGFELRKQMAMVICEALHHVYKDFHNYFVVPLSIRDKLINMVLLRIVENI